MPRLAPPPAQRLLALLAVDDAQVLDATLAAVAALARRSSVSRGSRFQDTVDLGSRLAVLAAPLLAPYSVRGAQRGRSEPGNGSALCRCASPDACAPLVSGNCQGLSLLPSATLADVPPAAVAQAKQLYFEYYISEARASRGVSLLAQERGS